MNLRYLLIIWLLSLGARLAAAQAPAPCAVFVVGSSRDANALARTLRAVTAQVTAHPGPSTLVVADEQLARYLLPASAAPQAEVLRQLRAFPGRLVIVPGGDGQSTTSLTSLLAGPGGHPGTLLPDSRCPDPVELSLDAQHTLLVLNTTWWLHAPAEPTPVPDCTAQTPEAVLRQLGELLRRNQGRHVLLVGQHALALSSWHLPVLPNPTYQLLRTSLRQALAEYPGLAYVSAYGHRHARYDQEQGLHYFGSGSAAPRSQGVLGPGRPAPVGQGGFTRFDYLAGSAVRASYWLPGMAGAPSLEVAAQQWVEPCAAPSDSTDPAQPTEAVVEASTRYRAGRFRQWLQGANYRREWQQPLRVPVLNLATAHGGLVPLKQGGGLQTRTLRLRAASGQEFVLRSVEKNTDGSVPGFLHRTLAARLVQDEVSAAHPYAALLVPPLAEAAGVGHPSPQLVLVPDDPQLGIYRREFAGMLATLEARDPAPPRQFRGQPLPTTYSTTQVLALLRADPRNRVDERALLRARLLDMVLADWDRHDEQWRWLAYPRSGGGLLLRAMPRDRDQALFVNEGFLPRRARVPYLLPRIQGFDYTFQNVNTFNTNARHFDRSFLTQLSRADWRAVADSVQASLTDSVLLAGLGRWPEAIRCLSGAAVLAKLQAHRAQLPAWADQYYRFLARAVDVVGSDAAEEFYVVRPAADRTEVRVYARTVVGQRGYLRYQRTFWAAETREIRLYGLGGADVVTMRGPAASGLLVRVVGGEGLDTLRTTKPAAHRLRAYDAPGGLVIAGPGQVPCSTQPAATEYDRLAFRYAYTAPRYPFGYNRDDGLFVGLGVLLKRPGFGRQPWATTHELTGNVALRTGAFSFGYEGRFTRLLGSFDGQVQATLQAPNYLRSFYGLGNNSVLAPDEPTGAAYYRVRFRNLELATWLRRPLGQRAEVAGGLVYQRVQVEYQPGRLLDQQPDERLHLLTLYAPKQYAGGQLRLGFISLHAAAELPQGLRWHGSMLALRPLTASARALTQFGTDLAVYRSFRWPLRLTLAMRLGGLATVGPYEFFQAATLGGLTNLRGYGRTRFAGQHSIYHNAEVRLQVAHFRSYLVPATVGVLAFHDVGRVWLPGESSRAWHRGYGPGLWLAPTPQVVLAAYYGLSPEGALPLVRLGFFF